VYRLFFGGDITKLSGSTEIFKAEVPENQVKARCADI